MRRLIPSSLISVVADAVSDSETHASLNSLFLYAEVPGDPPPGSKHTKALEWIRRINKDETVADPLAIIGRLIEGYLEAPLEEENSWDEFKIKRNNRILKALAQSDLQYIKGGKLVGSLAAPSQTLQEIIRGRDLTAINHEFDRAYENVEKEPREAVSAACNILESVCKTYIEDEKLDMPAKQDLQPVWSVVRKNLGFDPAQIADRDLQEILSGLIAVVSWKKELPSGIPACSASGTCRAYYGAFYS
jgi:hypothetical protein